MGIKKGQELTLDVTGTAFGGKGLARTDGMVVFIDGAVPGDRVRCRVVKKKRRFAEARVVDIVTPSSDRIDAPCAYSGFCGGCKWQFLAYPRQLEYKRRHVVESLEHLGGLDGVPVHGTLPSVNLFGYRNKMEFSCSDRRWLLPEEMADPPAEPDRFALGLHVPGTFSKVIDIRRCLIQPEEGSRILNNVRDWMVSSGLPAYGLRSHEGFWRFLVLRHSRAFDRWMVNIVTAWEDAAVLGEMAERIMAQHPSVISVVNNVSGKKAGIAVGDFERLLAGDSVLRERIGRFYFDISANSFFQTNTAGAETLYETVRAFARLQGDEQVVDLYSGAGTISIYLSEYAKEIVGIELVESSVADAVANARKNSIDNCRFILGDVKDIFGRLGFTPDVLIVDPPRAGMHPGAVRQILEAAPGRIVYVSCNPATMARDLAMMKDAYRVAEVQPVDMFPHTFHIEAVCRMERRQNRGG